LNSYACNQKNKTMKRLLYLIIVIPILLSSCEMSPEALFSVDKVEPVVGEEVFFTNQSFNAERFEWNFGDGTFSDATNPIHIYTGTGTYQVELKAVSGSGISAKAYQTINVKIPTLLEIEVLEYYEKYPVENASILLYPTLSDWDNEKNSITEGITDANGKVVFTGLGKYVYYADIWEAHHNNYTLRKEDVSFIRTPEVIPNKINRFVAYVDYVAGGKGDGKRDRTMVIKRIERK
jgi:PKD repeat protein